MFDQISRAPTNSYKAFSQQKNKKPKKRIVTSLPKHIHENPWDVEFGCGTLPSDNMNMIMTHEFEHAFVYKQQQKLAIEREMEKMANYQAKNAKYNVYITKA